MGKETEERGYEGAFATIVWLVLCITLRELLIRIPSCPSTYCNLFTLGNGKVNVREYLMGMLAKQASKLVKIHPNQEAGSYL